MSLVYFSVIKSSTACEHRIMVIGMASMITGASFYSEESKCDSATIIKSNMLKPIKNLTEADSVFMQLSLIKNRIVQMKIGVKAWKKSICPSFDTSNSHLYFSFI